MKKICVLMLLAMASAFPMVTMAQNKQVKIAQFERSHTSLIASMNQVKDNNGDICAVIRFWNTDPDYVIEPNLGVVKTEQHSGETRLWVPKGTKRITIRHINDRPLRGYSIPVDIESKGDYDAENGRKYHGGNGAGNKGLWHYYCGGGGGNGYYGGGGGGRYYKERVGGGGGGSNFCIEGKTTCIKGDENKGVYSGGSINKSKN